MVVAGVGGPACTSCLRIGLHPLEGEGHKQPVKRSRNLRPVSAKFQTFLNLVHGKDPPCCFKCNQGLYLCKFQNVAYALYKTG